MQSLAAAHKPSSRLHGTVSDVWATETFTTYSSHLASASRWQKRVTFLSVSASAWSHHRGLFIVGGRPGGGCGAGGVGGGLGGLNLKKSHGLQPRHLRVLQFRPQSKWQSSSHTGALDFSSSDGWAAASKSNISGRAYSLCF